MNRKQKIAVLIGTVLVVLTGLFPPHVGTLAKEGDNWRRFIGYHFLFSPPSQEQICTILLHPVDYSEEPTDRLGEQLRELRSQQRARQYAPNCSSSIDLARFGVQIVVILLTSVGAVFLLSERKV